MCVTMPVAMLQDFVQHARASIGSRRWRLGLGSSGMAANRPRVLWMRMCVVRSDTDVSVRMLMFMPCRIAMRFGLGDSVSMPASAVWSDRASGDGTRIPTAVQYRDGTAVATPTTA